MSFELLFLFQAKHQPGKKHSINTTCLETGELREHVLTCPLSADSTKICFVNPDRHQGNSVRHQKNIFTRNFEL